jgi:hypothetical protein
MATIRLAGGSIITKDGKVSCSCCESPEPDCCMYPADKLGDTYEADDLPDAVTINWPGHLEGSADKDGSGYEGAGGDVTLTVIDGKWTLKDTSTNPETVRVVGNCLIRGDGNLTQGDDLVEDQFADCYEVDGPDGTLIVTRLSLCEWASPPVEFGSPDLFAFLAYIPINPEEGGPSPIWVAGMDDGRAEKPAGGEKSSPNLSSPEGTYTSFLPSVTVTETTCP